MPTVMDESPLPDVLRDAYLARIGLAEPPRPTVEGLALLVERHLATVPFENLDVFRRVPVVLDSIQAVRKVALARRGGFCFELNEAFRTLVATLGFVVRRIEGRVWIAPEARFGPPFDHLALVVTLPDGEFLVDVGFGDSFRRPLRLPDDVGSDISGSYRLAPTGDGLWLLERTAGGAGAQPLYRMTTGPRRLDDFSALCAYHQSSSQSLFMRGLICTLPTPTGRVTLTARRLVETRQGVSGETEVRSSAHLIELLRDRFGIDLEQEPRPSGPVL